MNSEPGTSKRKSVTLSVLPPIIDPLLKGAGKLNGATQSGLVWIAKKIGSDGGGIPISHHWGAAADHSARAWWGNGPIKNGGTGMAGGNAKLALAGNIVAGTVIIAVVAAPVVVDLLQLRKPKPTPVTINVCESCQAAAPQAAEDGTAPVADGPCPHCGGAEKD